MSTDSKNKDKKRRFIQALPILILLLGGGLLLLMPGLAPDSGADPAPTTTAVPGPGDQCGSNVHFYTTDTTGHRFGPAVPEELTGARAELGNRLCHDPALAVVLAQYVGCTLTSPDERVAKTVEAINVPAAWSMNIQAVLTAVDSGNPRIAPRSGGYQTMYMVMDGRQVPEVYATSPDRESWQSLQFDTPCGQKNLKLDCGFQPDEQTFPPSVPTAKQPPSKSQPPKVPAPPKTAPPATQQPSKPGQPTTPPPSTQPPTTQPPPSTPKCPTTGTCGTPDSGPEFIPPQANDPALVAPTPGYTPGRAETVIPAQTPKPGADPYKPTPVGTQGTGSGGQTPVGQTDTPSGAVDGGSAGASNGATNNTSNGSGSTEEAPPP